MVDIKYTLTSGRLLVELPRKMKFGFVAAKEEVLYSPPKNYRQVLSKKSALLVKKMQNMKI